MTVGDLTKRLEVLEQLREDPPEPDWNDILRSPGLHNS